MDWMDIDDTADAYENDELQVDDQVFQPYLDPDDPNFNILFKQVVFHIIKGH